MNINASHLEALKALGYTEAEARFVYLVATHSGYFVARQFLAFTNAHWGYRTNTFWNKLHTKSRRVPECVSLRRLALGEVGAAPYRTEF
jgi:hypothetical protein